MPNNRTEWRKLAAAAARADTLSPNSASSLGPLAEQGDKFAQAMILDALAIPPALRGAGRAVNRTYEAQYDAERGTVTCVAQTEFGGDRYAVTTPATSKEDANRQAREFVAMYRTIEGAA